MWKDGIRLTSTGADDRKESYHVQKEILLCSIFCNIHETKLDRIVHSSCTIYFQIESTFLLGKGKIFPFRKWAPKWEILVSLTSIIPKVSNLSTKFNFEIHGKENKLSHFYLRESLLKNDGYHICRHNPITWAVNNFSHFKTKIQITFPAHLIVLVQCT